MILKYKCDWYYGEDSTHPEHIEGLVFGASFSDCVEKLVNCYGNNVNDNIASITIESWQMEYNDAIVELDSLMELWPSKFDNDSFIDNQQNF